MIEETVKNYLERTLNIPAYMEVPKDPPPKYILVEKTGSSRTNYINSSTLAIQSLAESLYKAAELNEAIKTVMDNIVILDEICSSELNSDYNYTDMSTKRYRYQAVYDLVHY